jgi:hypothetical protein
MTLIKSRTGDFDRGMGARSTRADIVGAEIALIGTGGIIWFVDGLAAGPADALSDRAFVVIGICAGGAVGF